MTQLVGINEPGVLRSFKNQTDGTGRYVEGLYDDESGELAKSMRAQIQACNAAGPVDGPMGSASTVKYIWTIDSTPQANDLYTATYTAEFANSITMFSVAHVGKTTMIGLAQTKQLVTYIEPEEYASVATAAAAKLKA